MRYQRGDVVIVFFPFTSGAGGKLRPALVVQNDTNNRRVAISIVYKQHRFEIGHYPQVYSTRVYSLQIAL